MVVNRSMGRRGFTLVEMMIAMIITLMIVFAMVEAFRWVGETTTEGRAVIEMLGQMRQARFRVEDDLTRLTVPGRLEPPCLDASSTGGYIEIVEGYGDDTTPERFLVRVGNVLMYSRFNFADPNDDRRAASASLFGDVDDVVCFTMHNDTEPFRGRLVTHPGPDGIWHNSDDLVNVIESADAEVVWWAELNDRVEDVDGDGSIVAPQDTDGDGIIDVAGEGGYGVWDPGELFTIRRRVLLIRPDLNHPISQKLQNTAAGLTIEQYQLNNDISVHYHADPQTHVIQGLAANSRGDLSRRENRVCHPPINYGLAGAGGPFGWSSDGSLSAINLSLLPIYTHPQMVGEDVVLNNVTAFDLRVWEPNAPICSYTSNIAGEPAEGLVPGDPGFEAAILADNRDAVPAGGRVVGRGAYVDLGCLTTAAGTPNQWSQSQRTTATPPWNIAGGNQSDDDGVGGVDDAGEAVLNPLFLGGMDLRARLPAGNYVYDPWPVQYENDGLDQDTNGVPDQGPVSATGDGNLNADYDVFERETQPPYLYRLSSLQVRIRMYESDTRQVRQSSQVVKFGD